MSTIPRHLKIGLILIVIAGVVSFGYFENVVGRIRSMVREPEKEATNPFVASTEPLFSSADPPLAVKVFFPPVSGPSILSSEQRTIFKSSELTNRAKQLLKLIIDGPVSKESAGSHSQGCEASGSIRVQRRCFVCGLLKRDIGQSSGRDGQ